MRAATNGDVDYFNRQWLKFTGLSFEQIRDWGWLQFIHPDEVEENIRGWKHSVETQEPFYLEHRFLRADGQYRWHVSLAMPMRDAEGKTIMWIGSNTDIEEVPHCLLRQSGGLGFKTSNHTVPLMRFVLGANQMLSERARLRNATIAATQSASVA